MSRYYSSMDALIGKSENIIFFTYYDGMQFVDRMAILAILISGFSFEIGEQLAVVELFLNCFVCAFPGFAEALKKTSSISSTEYKVTEEQFNVLMNLDEYNSGTFLDRLMHKRYKLDAVIITNRVAIHSALASLLFCIGKPPFKDSGNKERVSSTAKLRPDALISRFKIKEENQGLLPLNTYGPITDSLDAIFISFSTYTEPRMLIVQFLISVAQQNPHLPAEIEAVMTNFRLLKGVQLAHMTVIVKLMYMHPWTIKVPELTPYYMEFARELALYAEIPREYRPYHRLLVPQQEFLFVSSTYRPLIAVACSFVRDVESTFESYIANIDVYQSLINRVREYDSTTVNRLSADHLSTLLKIPDIALPPPKKSDNQVVSLTV